MVSQVYLLQRPGDRTWVRGNICHRAKCRRFRGRGCADPIQLSWEERSLSQSKPDPKALALNSELAGLDGRYIELAEMLGQGEMTRVEYQVVKRSTDDCKAELERTLAKERGVIALAGKLGSPQLITQKWESLNLDRQRAILKAISESVQVDKVIQKGMPFNPQRLRPFWKF